MRQMYEGEIDKAEVQQLQVRFFRTQMGMPAPTIAVVNGPAVGQVRGTRLVVQSLCGLGLVGRGPL
jgi:enoyl-CoA hydratase/carnithine racemase